MKDGVEIRRDRMPPRQVKRALEERLRSRGWSPETIMTAAHVVERDLVRHYLGVFSRHHRDSKIRALATSALL